MMLLDMAGVPKYNQDTARRVVDVILAEPDAFAETCRCLPPLRLQKLHLEHIEALLDASKPMFELYTALSASTVGMGGRFWNAYFTFIAAEGAACHAEKRCLSPLPAAAGKESNWDDSLGSLCASPVAASPVAALPCDELALSPVVRRDGDSSPCPDRNLVKLPSAASTSSAGLSREPSTRLASAFALLIDHEEPSDVAPGASMAATLFSGVKHAATQLVLDVREVLDAVAIPPSATTATQLSEPRQGSSIRVARNCLTPTVSSMVCGIGACVAQVMRSKKDLDVPMLKLSDRGLSSTREEAINDAFVGYW